MSCSARPLRGALRLAAACVVTAAPAARAQDVGLEAVPGSAAERYLRALQVAGEAPLYPWSVRGFSPAETDHLLSAAGEHPWDARSTPGEDGARVLRPRLAAEFNSAFAPVARADGAVWAGRGLTVSGSAGVALRWGALSARVEPVAFWAQNTGFALMPTGVAGDGVYADPVAPINVDLPQRFGDGAYARVDPGQTGIRLDWRGMAAGVGTETQQWGPAVDQPLILGPAGPGFPHAFVGTASPRKVGVGRVHGRIVWGLLEQSAYAPAAVAEADRFMAGITAVFLPWGLDGLEVGGTRFFHLPRDGAPGARDLLRPVEGIFKLSLPGNGEGTSENQLASVHARWVLPRARLEVYGEYGREDHNVDLLDFFLEPDHTAFYLLGGSRAWRRGGTLLWVRAELVNGQVSHLRAVRRQGRTYTHSELRQGHTHRGQLLGSPAVYGGGGGVLAVEGFTPRGRWRVDWTRTRMRDNWGANPAVEPNEDAMTDVVHSLGAEAVLFRGALDLQAGLRASWEINRHFAGDAVNLSADLGVRLGL